jgi:hypothetical protein
MLVSLNDSAYIAVRGESREATPMNREYDGLLGYEMDGWPLLPELAR